jgi:hypothetical protein
MVHDTVPAFPQVSFTLQNITVEAAFRGNNPNDATLDDEQTSE